MASAITYIGGPLASRRGGVIFANGWDTAQYTNNANKYEYCAGIWLRQDSLGPPSWWADLHLTFFDQFGNYVRTTVYVNDAQTLSLRGGWVDSGG